jgi:hypothetical protein
VLEVWEVQQVINNERPWASEPFYAMWLEMLRRCYDPRLVARYPHFEGCTVCDRWHRLSNFWDWLAPHWESGLYLTKDIIVPGNKVYGPGMCCCVPLGLHQLVADKGIEVRRRVWLLRAAADEQTDPRIMSGLRLHAHLWEDAE